MNEECLVSAGHQPALITSLPFVHTARRSYRLDDPVRLPDRGVHGGSPPRALREVIQTLSSRGRRSRNKVSVGEPAEGSVTHENNFPQKRHVRIRKLEGFERKPVLRNCLFLLPSATFFLQQKRN